MEKFRKFDDASCGKNPFTPIEPTDKFVGWQGYARSILNVFLIFLRVPCIGIMAWMYVIAHFFKYFSGIPAIIRWVERCIDNLCMKVMLSTCGYNVFKKSNHREHKDWSWEKHQKGEQEEVKNEPVDVILANSQSFADWAFLTQHYSPVFTKIVHVELANGESKVGLRPIGIFEMFFASIGLKFPTTVTTQSSDIYYNIKELIDSTGSAHYKGRRPIVIHPEGTKTNGLGVLQIDKDLVKMISAAAEKGLKIHTIRFDYEFKYWAPMNTTDELGFRNLLGSVQQFTSKMKIQYYQNVEGPLNECKNEKEKTDLIIKSLMAMRKEQAMKLSWRDHQEFMKMWNETKKNN